MSKELTEDVLATSPLKGSTRLIHLILAFYADKHGRCEIDQRTLAELAGGCSVRQVQKILAEMRDLGLIEVYKPVTDWGNFNGYRVLSSREVWAA